MDISFFVLALFGTFFSLYFCAILWQWLPEEKTNIARNCIPFTRVCRNLLKEPQSRVFNIPNPLLGLFFYLFLMYQFFFWESYTVALNLCAIVLIYSIYLVYQLIFKLKKKCIICMAIHVLNGFLFLILLLKRVS